MSSAWASLLGYPICTFGCGGVQRGIDGVAVIAFRRLEIRPAGPDRIIEGRRRRARDVQGGWTSREHRRLGSDSLICRTGASLSRKGMPWGLSRGCEPALPLTNAQRVCTDIMLDPSDEVQK
jgi:hypothetical protein